MDLIQAFILGVVEGISEFLPISSTGHLILTENLMRISQTEFVKSFTIAIQCGAILSVIVLYWKKILNNYKLLKQIIVAFIPTAIIGFLLYKLVKHYLLGNPEVVLVSLFVGGIALIGVELLFKNKNKPDVIARNEITKQSENHKSLTPIKSGLINNHKSLTYEKAFVIGLFQSIAIIPGVSRSASTIVGGLLVGLDRKTATEFSFLIAIPTLLAATALDLKDTGFSFDTNQWLLLGVGLLASFIVALISIKWLVKYVQTNTFIPFGIYRIVLAILYFVLVMN